VDRAAGAQVHELPLADDAAEDRHPRPGRENNQRLTKLALEILGSHAQLTNGGGYADGYWQYQQLRSRGNTIEAGTSEILRNIVAERVLGMPRSR
jgi:alkylation response protein AidB-like acyl-CoA dehydrogenase